MFEKVRLVLILTFAVTLRWCVTYHPYSGQGKPPMFGDYEAQRHWQEITLNLPIREWYTNSTSNDLQYWGLDYPPLTAYHSLLLAHVANATNPSYVELRRSRGFESDGHKLFMRLSVLIADVAVYIPALCCFFFESRIAEAKKDTNVLGLSKREVFLAAALIYPGLILIDYGHFQYNCVSLGLFVAAVVCLLDGLLLRGSALFVMALNYKQMELYHSLPFFFFILGSSVRIAGRSIDLELRKLLGVALVVLATFGFIWLPFLGSIETLLGVVTRLFPIGRGIFEDKVANVWCSLNVIYKLRRSLSDLALAKICLCATVAAVIPSNFHLFLRPKRDTFILSLVNTSLAFFLFSFQVHEKSVLLVAVPVLLHTHDDPLACFWFLTISNFSMSHLYVKDHLFLAYVAATCFYLVSIHAMFPELFYPLAKRSKTKDSLFQRLAVKFFYVSVLGTIALNLAMVVVEPPLKYPDLFPVLISLYSFAHFVLFFIYFNYKQFVGYHHHDEKVKST